MVNIYTYIIINKLLYIDAINLEEILIFKYLTGGNICYAKDGILRVPFSSLSPKEVKHIISGYYYYYYFYH